MFFQTDGDDWAGIPDVHGVYCVLKSRVLDKEMARMMVSHAAGEHNETMPPRYTKYFRGERVKETRRNSRKPRRSKRIRNCAVA